MRTFAILLALVFALALPGCEPRPDSPGTLPAPSPPASPAEEKAVAAPPAVPPPVAGAAAGPSNPAGNEPARPDVLQLSEEQKDIQGLLEDARKAAEAGDPARAIDRLGDVLAIDSRNQTAALERSRLCRAAGRHEEALLTVQAALAQFPDDRALLEERAWAELEKGDARRALTTVGTITSAGAVVPGARYLRAVIHASLRERDEALRALEDAVEHSFLDLKRMENEKRLDFLRSEERFKAVVEKIRGLREHAAREGQRMFEREARARAIPQVGKVDSGEFLVELERRLRIGEGEEISFDFDGIDGRPLRLSDCAGKPLIVVCSGTWSEWGRSLLIEATRLREDYASRGLEVHAFFYEPEPDPAVPMEALDAVKNHLRSFDIRLPSALMDEQMARSLRVGAYPSTLFFAADGKCYLRASGYLGESALRQLTEALLKGPAPGARGG